MSNIAATAEKVVAVLDPFQARSRCQEQSLLEVQLTNTDGETKLGQLGDSVKHGNVLGSGVVN